MAVDGEQKQVGRTTTHNTRETARRKMDGPPTSRGHPSMICGWPIRRLSLEVATTSMTHQTCPTRKYKSFTMQSNKYPKRRGWTTDSSLPRRCRRREGVLGQRHQSRRTAQSGIQDCCSHSTAAILVMTTGRCRIHAQRVRSWA